MSFYSNKKHLGNISIINITLLLIFVPSKLVYAEAECSSNISFIVERTGASPSEVFFTEVVIKDSEELKAKSKLEVEVLKTKSKALELCKKQNENITACMQTKISSLGSTLPAASFTARKALEEALKEDCRKQQGTCKEAKASEVKCSVTQSSEPTDSKGAAKKEEKPKK